jgi:uncharacterized protein (UPF0248 family)
VDLSKLSIIFKVIIIAIIYLIIFIALRLMYKDIKNGGRTKNVRKSFGLEVVEAPKDSNLKKGSLVPIHRMITIGRKEDNLLQINDAYASSHHAKVYVKNEEYIVEDLGSTNGTFVNSERISNKVILKAGDEIKIASYIFKVIG